MVKLLVPLDGAAASEAVLDGAGKAAARLNAEVHLVTVVPPGREHGTFELVDSAIGSLFPESAADTTGRPIGSALTRELAGPAGMMVETRDQAIRRVLDDANERLHRIAARFALPNIRTIVCLDTDPARRLIRYVEEEAVDLIAMATHSRTRIGRAFFGSVAEAIVRDAHKPVLLLGPHGVPAPPELRHLIVCVDGSPLSEAMLPVAAYRAESLQLKIILVQVISPRSSQAVAGLDIPERAYVERSGKLLHERGIEAAWEVLHGSDVAAAICAYAAQMPDAVVALSTHSRVGVARLALGSVAMGVVHTCANPVLVFHPRQIETANV